MPEEKNYNNKKKKNWVEIEGKFISIFHEKKDGGNFVFFYISYELGIGLYGKIDRLWLIKLNFQFID